MEVVLSLFLLLFWVLCYHLTTETILYGSKWPLLYHLIADTVTQFHQMFSSHLRDIRWLLQKDNKNYLKQILIMQTPELNIFLIKQISTGACHPAPHHSNKQGTGLLQAEADTLTMYATFLIFETHVRQRRWNQSQSRGKTNNWWWFLLTHMDTIIPVWWDWQLGVNFTFFPCFISFTSSFFCCWPHSLKRRKGIQMWRSCGWNGFNYELHVQKSQYETLLCNAGWFFNNLGWTGEV